ncbi:tetratricopeptide repeat protein [Streptomyces sp. NPDC020801]|uniref:tetratricopeptide repeat protein n=1 Tax=unclassified Streptomyces TaxID=2593676 RepID=UPI00379EDA7A
MSRLSREKKRELKHAGHSVASVATPITVHVPVDGAGASVGGVPVHSAPGEEIQHAVLNHLRRLALASGHPVLATVTDERIGYVVPLQVRGDGSSAFTAEPLRTAPPQQAPTRPAPPQPAAPRPAEPPRDRATHVLRQVQEPTRESAPTFPLRALSEPQLQPRPLPVPQPQPQPQPQPPAGTAHTETAPTFPLRALPESADAATAAPPGTATAPIGEFGPPPVMDARPPATDGTPAAEASAEPAAAATAGPAAEASAVAAGTAAARRYPDPALGTEPEPDPKPTPARGFDAVAEAVLGDDPRTMAGEGGAVLFAEPLARVNEAVKAGRIEEASALAERTVTEASGTLGPEHPEVLRLRELTAYIAYLAGEPLRAFGLSLDLARIRRRARDAEGAYGNVQSATAAWRAVRDPEQGLRLGRDLIDLWTELTAEDGPAADDIEQLESARARMGRLAERARRSAPRSGL